ncbi:hypothetical protein PS15p_208157 [Mucor circinelloides]
MWIFERTTKSSNSQSQSQLCCSLGDVKLPPKSATLKSGDFATSPRDRRYADALGKKTLQQKMIESSSDFEKENISYSLDDALKLLAECSNTLLHVIKHKKKQALIPWPRNVLLESK